MQQEVYDWSPLAAIIGMLFIFWLVAPYVAWRIINHVFDRKGKPSKNIRGAAGYLLIGITVIEIVPNLAILYSHNSKEPLPDLPLFLFLSFVAPTFLAIAARTISYEGSLWEWFENIEETDERAKIQ